MRLSLVVTLLAASLIVSSSSASLTLSVTSAVFSDLRFSDFGTAGTFRITFFCERAASRESVDIQVLTSVTNVTLLSVDGLDSNDTVAFVPAADGSMQAYLASTLLATNATGVGVGGKTLSVEMVSADAPMAQTAYLKHAKPFTTRQLLNQASGSESLSQSCDRQERKRAALKLDSTTFSV